MTITEEIKSGLNVALNHATLNYVEFHEGENSVKAVLDCLAVELNGEFPLDTRIILDFVQIGRISASYRLGKWNDETAIIKKITNEQELTKALKELSPDSMYRIEFFEKWSNQISFDYTTEKNLDGFNTIDLFAEQFITPVTTVDIGIWFKALKAYTIDNRELSIEEFIARGRRGWDRLSLGGLSTKGHRIWGIEDNEKE
jgi:hypothetical protein